MNKLKIANVNNPYEDVIECTDILKEDGTEVKIMTKGDFTDDFKTRQTD